MKITALVIVSKTTLGEFRRKFPGAVISEINGREVIGFCENCAGPIFDGSFGRYEYDAEGIMWHKRCPRSAEEKA